MPPTLYGITLIWPSLCFLVHYVKSLSYIFSCSALLTCLLCARLESIENRGHGDLRARGALLKIGRRSSRKPSQNHGNRSRAEDDPYRSSSPAGCGRAVVPFFRYINFANGSVRCVQGAQSCKLRCLLFLINVFSSCLFFFLN